MLSLLGIASCGTARKAGLPIVDPPAVPTEKPEPAIRVMYGSPMTYYQAQENQPLVVVDGEVKPGFKLSDIDPRSIADVVVMKSEDAVAKYGDKAKGGAVLVTLKKSE